MSKLIIFDLDGVLVEAKEIHFDSLNLALKDIDEKFTPSREDRIKTLIRQVEVFDRELGDVKSFAVMKKFFKTYMNGFEDAKEVREKIMSMESAGEVMEFLEGVL